MKEGCLLSLKTRRAFEIQGSARLIHSPLGGRRGGRHEVTGGVGGRFGDGWTLTRQPELTLLPYGSGVFSCPLDVGIPQAEPKTTRQFRLRRSGLSRMVGVGARPAGKKSQSKRPPDWVVFALSNQDGKTIAEKALFYKGFGHFCCCKFRFTLLVFEPLTPMYFIKIFRNNKIVCGYTKKSPPI